jgi:hypothetical protein
MHILLVANMLHNSYRTAVYAAAACGAAWVVLSDVCSAHEVLGKG